MPMAFTLRICPRNWFPSPSPLLAPRTKSGDVEKLHGRRHDALWMHHQGKLRKPIIWHFDDADVRINGAERIIRDGSTGGS